MSDDQDPPEDPAVFSRDLNRKVTSEALSDTILCGLVAMRQNAWTGAPEPDWPTRHKFALLAAQYKIGKPLERKEINLNSAGKSLDQMKALARKSPEFRKNIEKMLREILEEDGT